MRVEVDWKPVGDMDLIFPYLPQDTSRQYHAFEEALSLITGRSAAGVASVKLLDLGCGKGNSNKKFLQKGLNIEWHGLEIEDSPEAKRRVTGDAEFRVYDGIHIPFEDSTFDVVYSRQAFEHVHYPRELIKDIMRVLKKAGVFVGSCSALEPFHSRSIFNFTPYGFSTLLRDAGFSNILVRPGVDGLTLIARRLLGFARIAMGSWLFEQESPLNLLLELVTRFMRFDTRRRAAIKLLFCGHFVFSAVKHA